MHSRVRWALLGLVIERPSHAYDLAQRFERRYGSVLTLSDRRHAYAALRTLGERELIEQIPGTEGEGPHPKPSYRATAKGVAEYREWLIGQVGEDRRQHELFVLALSALTRQPEQMIEVVGLCEQEWLKEGKANPISQKQKDEPADTDETPDWLAPLLDRLIEEENRLTVGAKLEWVQYAREQLGDFAKGKPSAAARPRPDEKTERR